MKISLLASGLLSTALLTPVTLSAAQPQFPAPPTNEVAGFENIFDGRTLQGWDGDPAIWRVEDGCIVGETRADKPLKQNTFLIWRGAETRDFELKVEYRISTGGNSGLNYRSSAVDGVPWGLRGYQADIEGGQTWTGQVYEERGRGFLALRGQTTRVPPGQRAQMIGSMGAAEELKALIKQNDWNQLHVVARGNVLTHILNGRTVAVVLDEDPAAGRAEGVLGLQVHQGPPMKVEYRNLYFKRLGGKE